MNCEKCNELVQEKANFCPNCGMNLKPNNSGKNVDHLSDILDRGEGEGNSNSDFVIFSIIITVILLIIIISFFALQPNDEAQVNFVEEGCWTGVFNNGEAEMNIQGCESKSYECKNNDNCGIYAMITSYPDEDKRPPLCIELGGKEACTTIEYGYISINLNIVKQE